MGRLFISVGVGGSEGGRERHLWHSNKVVQVVQVISFHFLSGRRRAGPEGDQQFRLHEIAFFPLIIIIISTK